MEKPKTCAYILARIDNTSGKSIDQSESQKIYASMAHISSNAESPRRDFGDRLELTNWILDSGATCHMRTEILYCILVSLAETYKYIEVTDGHFVTDK